MKREQRTPSGEGMPTSVAGVDEITSGGVPRPRCSACSSTSLMRDVELQRENESLRAHNAQLLGQLADATQALEAFAAGEVDAVTIASSSTPLLVQAAQREARRESAEQLRRSDRLRFLAEAPMPAVTMDRRTL